MLISIVLYNINAEGEGGGEEGAKQFWGKLHSGAWIRSGANYLLFTHVSSSLLEENNSRNGKKK